MTIYVYTTPSQNEKDKAKLIPEVVTEPLNGVKDDAEEGPRPRLVRVTFFRRNGRSIYIQLLFALAVLVILACGALGAVVFYRHLHKKVYSGKCPASFYDSTYHNSLKTPMAEPMRDEKPPMDFFEEDIAVREEERIEELHTPAFDEVRETYIRHDFKMNFTAIVDHQYRKCFVMKLKRKDIAAPRTLIEMIHMTIKHRGYLQRARVIRSDLDVAYILDDLSNLGSHISHDCAVYPTHWLEKKVSGVYKRSAEKEAEKEETLVYAMMSNQVDDPVIYKLQVHVTHMIPLERAQPLTSG